MQSLSLLLAVFWLCPGIALVIWHWLHPEQQFLRMRWNDLSLGWLAILLAGYNLVRWWSQRSAARARRALEKEYARRERERHRHSEARAPVTPDPDFNFMDRPPRET